VVVTGSDRPRRIAYLSYSSAIYDARTFRMARWALDQGYEVTVYARWEPGLARVEEHDGYRIIRTPWTWRDLLPGRRQAGGAAAAKPGSATVSTTAITAAAAPRPRSPLRRGASAIFRVPARWARLIVKYPIRPLAWARTVAEVAEPADIWHGMWAGALPAMDRLRSRHGGRTIYDSRDMYMESRNLATAPRPIRALMSRLERRWARRADRVITVNRPYARLLATRFGIAEPAIVMNCPAAWVPPVPRPDHLRRALGLDATTPIVLYQGQLISDRGIEQAMDAILEVPGAILVLLGYGDWEPRFRALAAEAPYAGRVFLLPAVAPSELVEWTASADVMVMPIQPTTLNHRFTTPQKLFESIAAGVPVVASDLPGMAEIVNEIGAGVLCDATSPASIAAAIRQILDAPADQLAAMRARILAAAHERYSWETQVGGLRAIYEDLAPAPRAASPAP
jgi:glycosyltransferase involved in cell wall biosynthesis